MKNEFQNTTGQYEYDQKRIKEFLKLLGINSFFRRIKFFENKICLDAGCGPGRWTYAMQQLGAKKGDSIDISNEAVNLCKKINPNAYVYDIMNLEKNPYYDFVFSWGSYPSNEKYQKSIF